MQLSKMGRIMNLLRIVQFRTEVDALNERKIWYRRLHPYNPISYIIAIFMVLIAILQTLWDNALNIIRVTKDELFDWTQI